MASNKKKACDIPKDKSVAATPPADGQQPAQTVGDTNPPHLQPVLRKHPCVNCVKMIIAGDYSAICHTSGRYDRICSVCTAEGKVCAMLPSRHAQDLGRALVHGLVRKYSIGGLRYVCDHLRVDLGLLEPGETAEEIMGKYEHMDKRTEPAAQLDGQNFR